MLGSGSAGAVVASRLSENSDFQVLLLEAGGDETGITVTPGFYRKFVRMDQDWNYATESSSKFCLASRKVNEI
ncbi:Glucose dehydrogenase [FAD, quinone] [Armadillidium vulgare]|nr:Glucose dehydrogenase [FAD, quinone] [Armadillidium vulgare]